MTNGIRNALLFGAGALVAAVAVAYGLGAFAPTPAGKVADTTAPAGNSITAKEGRVPVAPGTLLPVVPAPDKPASGQAKDAGQPQAPQIATKDGVAKDSAPAGNAASSDKAAPTTDNAKASDVTAPSFDVVRAEGSGSIVVAGRSAPGAKVEILSGKNVLGTAAAGTEGDFAIVLDDPLKPGDYQLVLRSTTPANVVAMSKETAVVSIPEHENGQVLALVESPGQPSKLITIPQPEKTATASPAPAVPGAAQQRTSQTAGTTTAPAPGAPAAGAGARQLGATGAPSSGNTAAPSAGTGPAMASANGQAPAAVQPQISVEAVEIEGNKIFVAGIAAPGSTVRVYANDAVLGEAKTSPVGRFLVESIHELAVGDYIIRADMLAADGLKVAARAAVPFTRAPGESVAAVAPGEVGSGSAAKGAAGTPAGSAADAGSAASPANAGSVGTEPSQNTANDLAAAPGKPAAGGAESGGATAETAKGGGAPQALASNGQGSTVLPSLDNDISKQPPTIVSPKLQETSGAVIIRRGDTLWQISRRVYGHGVRYSTIYLANEDQIEDPDLIWPGQIFAVPVQTGKGETANMKAIASQATEVQKKAME